MNSHFRSILGDASQLVRAGSLEAATRAIQRALQSAPGAADAGDFTAAMAATPFFGARPAEPAAAPAKDWTITLISTLLRHVKA